MKSLAFNSGEKLSEAVFAGHWLMSLALPEGQGKQLRGWGLVFKRGLFFGLGFKFQLHFADELDGHFFMGGGAFSAHLFDKVSEVGGLFLSGGYFSVWDLNFSCILLMSWMAIFSWAAARFQLIFSIRSLRLGAVFKRGLFFGLGFKFQLHFADELDGHFFMGGGAFSAHLFDKISEVGGLFLSGGYFSVWDLNFSCILLMSWMAIFSWARHIFSSSFR